MKYGYNFHNILSVGSNIDLSDIVLPLDVFKLEDGRESYDLTIRLTGDKTFQAENYRQIAPGLYYSEKENRIASVKRILGIKLYWEVRNLLEKQTELLFNNSYYFLFKRIFQFPVSSLFQLNILIKMIMQVKLLLQNSTFLVGGATAFGEKGAIFTGMCGSGKTTMVLNIMSNFAESKYISDDMVILADETVYSFPSPIRVRKFNLNARFFKRFENPLQKFGKRFLPLLESDFDIYFLEKTPSTSDIRNIPFSEGVSKLCSINNRTLMYYCERILSSYAYISGNFFLAHMQKRQADILSRFFKNSNFYIISAQKPDDYVNLLREKYDNFA